MPRYRPPAPRSSPYVTEAGQRALREELAGLLERRREVVTHLAAAAAEGLARSVGLYGCVRRALRACASGAAAHGFSS